MQLTLEAERLKEVEKNARRQKWFIAGLSTALAIALGLGHYTAPRENITRRHDSSQPLLQRRQLLLRQLLALVEVLCFVLDRRHFRPGAGVEPFAKLFDPFGE